ncbi:transmembrane protein 218 isoform X1 [Larus michahellis]|uniref:transmembrane protein 218 isoform X1 n=1 Tax=Larus michahellis TaxID=119627 RepID=UPI003D9B93F5
MPQHPGALTRSAKNVVGLPGVPCPEATTPCGRKILLNPSDRNPPCPKGCLHEIPRALGGGRPSCFQVRTAAGACSCSPGSRSPLAAPQGLMAGRGGKAAAPSPAAEERGEGSAGNLRICKPRRAAPVQRGEDRRPSPSSHLERVAAVLRVACPPLHAAPSPRRGLQGADPTGQQWDETKNNTSLIRARRKAQGCSLCRVSGASSDLAQPSWSSVLKYRALGRSRPARETACGEKRSSPPSPRRPGRAPPGKGVEWQHRFCMFLFIKRPRVKNRPRKPVGQGPRTAPRRCLPPKQTRGGGTGSRGRA